MNSSIYDTTDTINLDFSKIRIGAGTLEDAVLEELYGFKKLNPRLGDKKEVMRALHEGDYATMRDISNFFYKTSGIYSRLCRYMAYLYRFDWMVTPYINSDNMKEEKILDTS